MIGWPWIATGFVVLTGLITTAILLVRRRLQRRRGASTSRTTSAPSTSRRSSMQEDPRWVEVPVVASAIPQTTGDLPIGGLQIPDRRKYFPSSEPFVK